MRSDFMSRLSCFPATWPVQPSSHHIWGDDSAREQTPLPQGRFEAADERLTYRSKQPFAWLRRFSLLTSHTAWKKRLQLQSCFLTHKKIWFKDLHRSSEKLRLKPKLFILQINKMGKNTFPLTARVGFLFFFFLRQTENSKKVSQIKTKVYFTRQEKRTWEELSEKNLYTVCGSAGLRLVLVKEGINLNN